MNHTLVESLSLLTVTEI